MGTFVDNGWHVNEGSSDREIGMIIFQSLPKCWPQFINKWMTRYENALGLQKLLIDMEFEIKCLGRQKIWHEHANEDNKYSSVLRNEKTYHLAI